MFPCWWVCKFTCWLLFPVGNCLAKCKFFFRNVCRFTCKFKKPTSLHLTFSWACGVASLPLICQAQHKTLCLTSSVNMELFCNLRVDDGGKLGLVGQMPPTPLCPCHLPSIYTHCLKEKKKKRTSTLDFLVSMLCWVCIMEALGANLFHVSMSPVLDKEQPVAEMSSENSHMTSCTAAGRHTVRGSFFIVSPPPLHKELFIWVSQRDVESLCPLGSSLS